MIITLKTKINILILSWFRAVFKRFAATLTLFIIIAFSHLGFAQGLEQLIHQTEQNYAIPSGLLKSIVTVESGFNPYALNISGKTIFASSKEEAVAIVHFYQNNGITNIDLGITQINLHWHGEHFSSISEMLEPKYNLEYAAKFLSELYRQHGSWCIAVRHYHSTNPKYHRKYSRKILIAWLNG